MDADATASVLGDLPVEKAEDTSDVKDAGAKGDRFDAAMEKTGNPEIEATNKSDKSDDDQMIDSSFGAKSTRRAV